MPELLTGERSLQQPGAMDQRQQRSVMIGGKWVKVSFYPGEILPDRRLTSNTINLISRSLAGL